VICGWGGVHEPHRSHGLMIGRWSMDSKMEDERRESERVRECVLHLCESVDDNTNRPRREVLGPKK
jgi:hypothetical protein